MLIHERKKQNALKKGRARQDSFRRKQRKAGLTQVRTKITRFSHNRAKEFKQKTGVPMEQIYTLSIMSANPSNPPPKHDPVIDGDEFGTASICFWTDQETREKLDELRKRYSSSTNAMSALIYHYTKTGNYDE